MTENDHKGKLPENLNGRLDEHLDEGDLILYLDHELGSEGSARVGAHLACCAECRRTEAELAESSRIFSSLQRDLDATLPAPPRNWAAFEERLVRELSEQPARREPWRRMVGNAWRKWRSNASLLPWGLATAAAALILGFLWFHAPAPKTASFSEIVKHVEERAASESAARPVVYRKLRISISTEPSVSTTIEMWKRKTDGRVTELEAGSPIKKGGTAANQVANRAATEGARHTGPSADSSLLAQVKELYAANHLDWTEPISVSEFKSWAASGEPKDEQVAHETMPGGGEEFRLIARAKNPLSSTSHDVVSEMQLLVRASDWHAITERLTVQTRSGVRTYEVAELEYRELPFSEVPSSIFEVNPAKTALAGDLPRSNLGIQPLSGGALTLDVLKRLDALDALVRDQVTLTRVGGEGLKVEGTLSSPQRKDQIIAALGPLASNPALKVDLVSAAEARDRASGAKSRPTQLQSFQVPAERQTPNAYLRKWFADHRGVSGAQLDGEAERFQMEAMVLSSDAQLQAQALQHILEVLPAAPEGDAAETWSSLVNRHANLLRQQVHALEQQLAPVFRTTPPRPGDEPKRNGSRDLKPEADRLVDLMTASDHILWQAFSTNSADSAQSQLTDPQFWLMLEEEDSLAAHLMQQARP